MLEVGHTHIGGHGVLEKHLHSAQMVGRWHLEEAEQEHVNYTQVS